MTIQYHPTTKRQLQAAVHTPAHCYIFSGPAGSGKTQAAAELADRLTGGTLSAQLIIGPDNPARPSIKLEQIRGLRAALALRPLESNQFQVAQIQAADALTPEAANALLKILEEPAPQLTIVLLTQSLQRLLPTIRSRAQIIRFLPTPVATFTSPDLTPQQNQLLQRVASDRPGLAAHWQADQLARTQAVVCAELAQLLLSGNLTQRFAAAKQLHELKLGHAIMPFLFRLSTDPGVQLRLLQVEIALRHNVSPRLLYEQLAVELS